MVVVFGRGIVKLAGVAEVTDNFDYGAGVGFVIVLERKVRPTEVYALIIALWAMPVEFA